MALDFIWNVRARMMAAVVVATAAVAISCTAASRDDAMTAINHEVALDRYTGTWYEFARTPNRYQDNRPTVNGKTYGKCAKSTATYQLDGEHSLRVKNACTRTAQDGSTYVDTARGVAAVVEGSGGRKLKIAFGPAIARFFQRLISFGGFNYWIYDLGETHGDAPYTWAIVSGPKRDFLYFLTRAQDPSPQVKEEMLSSARSAGLPVHKLTFPQQGVPSDARSSAGH